MRISLVHAQELEAARHRTREVAYNLNLRIRQQLGVPAVMHFYSWLLQGMRQHCWKDSSDGNSAALRPFSTASWGQQTLKHAKGTKLTKQTCCDTSCSGILTQDLCW